MIIGIGQDICDANRIAKTIDRFGESAPYKEVYKHFKLSEEDITNFIQKKLRE